MMTPKGPVEGLGDSSPDAGLGCLNIEGAPSGTSLQAWGRDHMLLSLF